MLPNSSQPSCKGSLYLVYKLQAKRVPEGSEVTGPWSLVQSRAPSSHCTLVGPAAPASREEGEGRKVWTPWEMKQPVGLPTGAAADRGKLHTSRGKEELGMHLWVSSPTDQG